MNRCAINSNEPLRTITRSFAVLCLLFLAGQVFAESISLTTYYPAPQASYDVLRLVPQAAPSTCVQGDMYVDSTTLQPMVCKSDGTWTAWVGSGSGGGGGGPDDVTDGIWVKDGSNPNNVYLKDSDEDTNLFLYVGDTTKAVEARYHQFNYKEGSIFSAGQEGAGASLPGDVQGAGTRLVWYPRKAAFRAGEVTGNQWSDALIGNRSSALGYNTQADKDDTIAIGNGAKATGVEAISLGSGQATALQAIAIGRGAAAGKPLASGQYSVAIGGGTAGADSVAIGSNVTATNSSVAIGNILSATNNNVAIGTGFSLSGDSSTGIGWKTGNSSLTAANTLYFVNYSGTLGIGDPAPSFGISVNGGLLAKGQFGSANILAKTGAGTRFIWYPRKAAIRAGKILSTAPTDQWNDSNIGNYSAAFGANTLASSDFSIAAGYYTRATTNTSAMAFGDRSLASGMGSFASGTQTQSTGTGSVATGDRCVASADGAVAMGQLSQATGIGSLALGFSVKALGTNSMAMGEGITAQGNKSFAFALDANQGTALVPAQTMAIMGGRVAIGTTTPSASKLTVAGLGGTASYYPLVYNTSTGDFYYYDSSTIKNKMDIKPLQDDWYKVLGIEPKEYVDAKEGKPDVGVIVDDMEALGLKNLMIYDGEGKPLNFEYRKLALYVLMIVKDQEKQIKQLKALVCQEYPDSPACE